MSTSTVHPMALVHPEAKLHPSVTVGPFTVIGPNVSLGENCKVGSHVVIDGHTEIGKNNNFFSFCSIGAAPQDTSYKNEPTRVTIGDNNTFREYVSVHRGTMKQDQVTIIGSDCLFMAYAHLGHDVTIGNRVIIVNSCNLAGHVVVGDRVTISGATNISQFIRIGRGAYIGGGSGIDRDIPPFCTAYGNRVKLKGINIIGLRRQGYSREQISAAVDFYRSMENQATMESHSLSPRSFVENAEMMVDFKDNPVVNEMTDFIKTSETGIAPFSV